MTGGVFDDTTRGNKFTDTVRDSIAFTGNNPFNLTVGGGSWQGARDSRSAAGHEFETFDDPIMGFRAGFMNHMTHNNRNIEAGKENSVYSLLRESTPYKGNEEFWDGNGAQNIVDQLGQALGRDIGLHQNIDLNNERQGRAFGEVVANMEIGSRGDPWGGIYDQALDLVYADLSSN